MAYKKPIAYTISTDLTIEDNLDRFKDLIERFINLSEEYRGETFILELDDDIVDDKRILTVWFRKQGSACGWRHTFKYNSPYIMHTFDLWNFDSNTLILNVTNVNEQPTYLQWYQSSMHIYCGDDACVLNFWFTQSTAQILNGMMLQGNYTCAIFDLEDGGHAYTYGDFYNNVYLDKNSQRYTLPVPQRTSQMPDQCVIKKAIVNGHKIKNMWQFAGWNTTAYYNNMYLYVKGIGYYYGAGNGTTLLFKVNLDDN